MRIASDIETNALVDPDKLWCICCTDVDKGTKYEFTSSNLSEFEEFAKRVSTWIGHHFIKYDWRCLRTFFPNLPKEPHIIDTLVLSRLFNYNIKGGHSLDAWGMRLGHLKSKFDDFSTFDSRIVERCKGDVEITVKLFKKWEKFLESNIYRDAIDLEHKTEWLTLELHENGFPFDFAGAQNFHRKILDELQEIDSLLEQAFPPKSKLIREITPIETANGTLHRKDFRDISDLSPYNAGAPFSRIEFVHFNAGSPKQIVERLNEAGWKPTEKTKGHIEHLKNRPRAASALKVWEEKRQYYEKYGWSINEENLNTLPKDAPEAARKLKERIVLDSRRSTLVEWIEAYRASTGRIHGNYMSIGAWTHRMSHNHPNMANIPSGGNVYGKEFRSLWTATPKDILVGVDAAGIQLRIFGHYIQDDEFIKAVCEGNSDEGTDPHTLNWHALGALCPSRDHAKTFIYAFLLGAGIARIANIFGCSQEKARRARENFLTRYEKLAILKGEVIPKDAERGYFVGFDGRYVPCDSEHLMLAGYLQNGESVVMKMAAQIWKAELAIQNLKKYVQIVNFVHDEWQTLVQRSEGNELAHRVGDIQIQALRTAGERLNLRCPMDGNKNIGENWYETH